jgi:replicative DNA helicase
LFTDNQFCHAFIRTIFVIHFIPVNEHDDISILLNTSAINLLAETKLLIDDTPALTPNEVRSRARRLTRDHGQLGLIVLDYLQLMQSPSSGESRVAHCAARP